MRSRSSGSRCGNRLYASTSTAIIILDIELPDNVRLFHFYLEKSWKRIVLQRPTSKFHPK